MGEFTLDQAAQLPELDHDAKTGRLAKRIIRLENLLPELPRVTILPIVESAFATGPVQRVVSSNSAWANYLGARGSFKLIWWLEARTAARFQSAGELMAIAEPVVPRTYQPVVVLEAIS